MVGQANYEDKYETNIKHIKKVDMNHIEGVSYYLSDLGLGIHVLCQDSELFVV